MKPWTLFQETVFFFGREQTFNRELAVTPEKLYTGFMKMKKKKQEKARTYIRATRKLGNITLGRFLHTVISFLTLRFIRHT